MMSSNDQILWSMTNAEVCETSGSVKRFRIFWRKVTVPEKSIELGGIVPMNGFGGFQCIYTEIKDEIDSHESLHCNAPFFETYEKMIDAFTKRMQKIHPNCKVNI